MRYVEVHENNPEKEPLLQVGLDRIEAALRHYGALDLSSCEFRIVRESSKCDHPGKTIPFLRIGIDPGEDAFVIVSLIRARGCDSEVATYGIDVVAMPIFIPPKKVAGNWYDPTKPLGAVQ